jgi:hypothetical protein
MNCSPYWGYPQVEVAVAAGNYRATLVNPSITNAALYSAWCYGYMDPNCWRTSYRFRLADGSLIYGGENPAAADAQSAFDATVNKVLDFNVSSNQTLEFHVTDSDCDDNYGGVSLELKLLEACSITCPADVITGTDAGQCGAIVSYPAPTVSGDCLAVVCSPASGSFFPVGTNFVTCTTNNTEACAFAVIVNDTEPPVITCPGNIVTNVPAGVTNAVVNFLPGATENCHAADIVMCDEPPFSTFPLGVTPVTCIATDESGNTNSCTFNVTVQTVAPEPHDMAVINLKAPKVVNLSDKILAQGKRVVVQIQNRSSQAETIPDRATLAELVELQVISLGEGCPTPSTGLIDAPPNVVPRTLKPKQKLNVFFNVIFNCANNPDKGAGREDFRYVATVHREALDGKADTHPECDVCPRPPLPGGVDPNPDGKVKDKGCGNKDKLTGQLGADVLTDVFMK